MAKLVLSKTMHSDWFFLGRSKRSSSCVFLFWSKASKFKICNQAVKKNVNIVILHSEISRKSKKD